MFASKVRLSLSLLLVLVVLSWWSVYLTRPPQARPATVAPTGFSAERAMQYVRQITREPHAMGMPGHARVRTYLLTTLRTLGLQPQVQEATVTGPMTNPASLAPTGAMFGLASRLGYVYNVMARIKGRQPGKAILLVAHYDSQPNTLGAADDGAGVAAILETARAIQQGDPLQHDIILLFTDGEEYGLFGAQAFLRHPWAKDVGFVINLEARGNSGPSILFETSSENGWIIEQIAKTVPHPMAASLTYEVYKKLPNSTDFTIFREAGYAGVNAAFIDGFIHYHKLTDSPRNLNQNSLQHHGDNMLALAQHLGNVSLDQTKAPDKVFFNVAGDWLVHYPIGLNWLWLALLTGALVTTLVAGFRQNLLTIGQVLGGLVLYTIMLLLVGGLCWGINLGILGALPLTHIFNGTYGSAMFFVAYTLLTVGSFGLLIRLVLRWLKPLSLVIGAYVLIYVLTLTNFSLLPTATYLFMFPLLSALVGLLIVLQQTRRQPEGQPAYALILLIATLPTVFMLLPVAESLFVTFDLQLPVTSVLIVGLTLALLLPLWLLIERGLWWRNVPVLPVVSFLLGAVVAIMAIHNEAPSAGKPLHSQVSYFLNTDTRQAVWASYGLLSTDDWNQQFFTNSSTGKLTEIYPNVQPSDQRIYLKNTATAISTAPPVAEIQSDVTTDSVRHLTLELRSPRGASNLEVALFPRQAGDVRSIRVNGEQPAVKAQQTSLGPAFDLLFYGLPVTKNVTLTIDLTAGSPLHLLLYDQSVGLPPELVKITRPAHVIPEQGHLSNLTVVGKTYQF